MNPFRIHSTYFTPKRISFQKHCPQSKGNSLPLWKPDWQIFVKQVSRTVTLQVLTVPYCQICMSSQIRPDIISNHISYHCMQSLPFTDHSNCTIHIYNLGFCSHGALVVSWEDGYTAKWLRLTWPPTVNYLTTSQWYWVTNVCVITSSQIQPYFISNHCIQSSSLLSPCIQIAQCISTT